jgi:two-component system cell cycle sensor histidine kinase/response regulator CckA
MGGELSLRSGSWGTAVTARLRATAPQERADEDPQQEVDGPKHVGGHVLVVEDEGSIRSLVEAALGGAGYQIVCASSPAEALELLADPDRQVDLLLTDVAMPEMDGFELVDRATATRPDLRAVFMSGYGERALTARGMDPDSAIMLGKPFRLAQLLAAVERALRRD